MSFELKPRIDYLKKNDRGLIVLKEDTIILQEECHCGSNLAFKDCCEIFLSQTSFPQTAEQLMRSRFTAFKLRNHDYLIKTVKVKENESPLTEQSFDTHINWLGLKVIASKNGMLNDQKGLVEFVAFYQEKQVTKISAFHQLHEISNFEMINGQWMYVDGIPRKELKLARNDECFCGSRKKFKKCHGR